MSPETVSRREALKIRLLTAAFASLLRIGLTSLASAMVLAPLFGANLFASNHGDDELLSHGARNLVTLLLTRSERYHAYTTGFLGLLGVFVLAKILLAAVSFDAIHHERRPGSRRNVLGALQLLLPFALLFGFAALCVMTVLLVYVALFPSIGSLLLPLLGERTTDLVQLSLLAFVLLLGQLGSFTLDLARSQLTRKSGRLREALDVAFSQWRRQGRTVVAKAAPRFLLSLGLYGLGLYAAQRCQLTLHGTKAALLVLLSVETGAFAAYLVFISWIDETKKLLSPSDKSSLRTRT
jgi:hypothetical protein